MSRLTFAARNMLVLTPEVSALVDDGRIAKGAQFSDGWIFADKPFGNIEKRSYSALVVITDAGTWQPPNPHNTSRFPRLTVDVWASPTRHPDGTPVKYDADLLIEDVIDAMRPYLHTVNMDVPGRDSQDPFVPYMGSPGDARFWGNAEEIATQTGVRIASSEILGEPDFSEVRDGNGARMGRISVGVHVI